MRQRQTRGWKIMRTFEPNRLSQANLVQAYQTIVPRHFRIMNGSGEPQVEKRQAVREEIERRKAA